MKNQHTAALLPRDQEHATWLAHAEIRAVVERYFYGLDARDPHALTSCFTDDAYYEANTGAGRRIVFHGAHAIGSSLCRLIRRFEHSLHAGPSPHIIVDGDNATVDVFASAHLVYKASGNTSSEIYIRGLRYQDSLIRKDGVWRIAKRVHQALWQHNAVGVTPSVPPPASAE